jgi:hypothetical protein
MMDRKLYPANWDTIALEIKNSVDWVCENCGRPCRKPRETIEDLEDRVREWPDSHEDYESDEDGFSGQIFKSGRFVLTVAHLDHVPSNCDRINLRAWCAPCHCRYDLSQMGRKKILKLEREGQLVLKF